MAKETVTKINYGRVYGHPEDGSLWTTNITSDAWYGEEVDVRNALADVSDELNRWHFCEFDVFLNGLKKGIQTTDLTRMVGWSDCRIGNQRVPYRIKTTMYDVGNGKMVPCGVILFDLSIMSIANRDDITLM